jgi:acylpyruvate hydrolase
VPGTVILTGTPSGVGMSRTPPVFLKHGDLVEVEIDGIGSLGNRVVFE